MSEKAKTDRSRMLTIELLTWISARPRTYADAMEVWRSSCPRHPVWDDALIDGLIQIEGAEAIDQSKVTLTARGQDVLDREGGANS
jgi:hypothetical protein